MNAEFQWNDDNVKEFVTDLLRTGFYDNIKEYVTDLLRTGFYDIPKHVADFKANKHPLFKSQDGVDYYADGGKKIYCLHDPSQWHIDEHPEFYEQLKQSYNRFFSTKEKAQEYILWNRPLFSLDEIRKYGGDINNNNPYFRALIQKAKEKLSNNPPINK